jgi:hypothetical protein
MRTRLTVARVAFIACTAGIACGPAPDAPLPDAGTDARDPFCGDGVVGAGERCDDGERNGGPDSLCRLNCVPGQVVLEPLGDVLSPYPVRGIDLVYGSGVYGVVVTAFDESGLHVLADLSALAPQWFDLHMGGAPTSFRTLANELGSLPGHVYWVEAGGTLARPNLYRASFDFFLPELPVEDLGPTPFADGQGGHLLSTRTHGEGSLFLLVADRGNMPPFPMHLGSFAIPSSSWVTMDSGPSPGVQEIAATDVGPWNMHDIPAPIVRYLKDPPSVAIHGVSWDGTSLTEIAQFEWEHEVVAAVGGGVDESRRDANNAFVTADGTVYTWSAVTLPKIQGPYASVTPGTNQIVALSRGDAELRDDYAVLESSGEIVFLANNTADRSLMPQRFQIGPPCTRCVLSAWRESTFLIASLDDHVYLMYVVPVFSMTRRKAASPLVSSSPESDTSPRRPASRP